MTGLPVVHSHEEWSALEEVIVGVPFAVDYSNDVSFRLFFHDNLNRDHNYSVFRGSAEGLVPDNQLRDECLEDLTDLVALLEKRGIVVKRPQSLSEVKRVVTPHWEAPMGHALMSRDLFLVVGDEIIETSVMVRSRYFEADLYRELFTDYFLRGARWTAAPRSRLLAENFDYEYVLRKQPGLRPYEGDIPSERRFEILFDGAQVLRFGRDLLFNCSTENHRMGLQWLRRHLGETYRVHEINIADNHIDSQIMPVRPGLLVLHRGVDREQLPAGLRKWDVIWYQRLDAARFPTGKVPLLASASIGMNFLTLAPDCVVVQDIQLPLIRDLESAGVTAIPCRWRHGRRLGGGLHCITLDIRRRGTELTYF